MAEKQEENEKEVWVANIFQISENIIIGSTEKYEPTKPAFKSNAGWSRDRQVSFLRRQEY